MTMEFHPLTEIFPLLKKRKLDDLRQDIKDNGLLDPITIYEGKILDGRNRWKACEELKIKPEIVEFKGKDPLAFVISANLKRRHLTVKERADIAASLLIDVGRGRPRKINRPNGPFSSEAAAPEKVTTAKIAEAMNVSERSVKRAKSKIKGKVKEKPRAPKSDGIVDETGFKVPEKALPYWHRRDEVKVILRAIANARSLIRDLDPKDKMFVEIDLKGVMARLSQAHDEFEPAVPYAVCPICQGVTSETCTLCKGRGVISKFRFKTCVPEEIKTIRAKAIV